MNKIRYLTEDKLLEIAGSYDRENPPTTEMVMAVEILNRRAEIMLIKRKVYSTKQRIDNDIEELYLDIERL
ncbi:hypothetical protein [Gilliamella sp. Pas-s25]|uniref:hypothetical protein n=1 Tax=Gilliamella sp. Pas-s25 TaxID=2687310 RepID=UPI00135E70C8|nr:hypothetical protein [Gilliamella sp. Pas-s25]MWP61092.1 hypothetical protein [Gilliamella sp. Pas-s25]